MDKVAVAVVLAVSLAALSVSADHGGPAPVVIERTYELGLIGDAFGVTWTDPAFDPVTEDGSADVAYVLFDVPQPEGADHPPTVQVRVEDRVVEGAVGAVFDFCIDQQDCPEVGYDFCGESEPLTVGLDRFGVRIHGPVNQQDECPGSDNDVGGVHGDITATFSWD